MNDKFAKVVSISKKEMNLEEPKSNVFKFVLDRFFYAGVAYIFSFIWFDLLVESLNLQVNPFFFALNKLIILFLLIALSFLPKYLAFSVSGLGLLTVIIGVIFRGSFGQPIYQFLGKHLEGIGQTLQWSSGNLSKLPQNIFVYIAVLSILIAVVFIYIKPMPLPLAIIWIIPYVISIRYERRDFNIWIFFIGLAIILITFARQGGFYNTGKQSWQIPPVFLITLIMVFIFAMQLIVPSDIFFNTRFNRYLDQMIKANQNMSDTVRYFEFSIKDAGYYPQDVHLGGPIKQQNLPFMDIDGPGEPFYLRGTIFNSFDQNIWYASNMSKNYLFYNEAPINQQVEAFLYKEKSPLKPEIFDKYFVDAGIVVEPIYQPIQAVFNGGKVEQIVDMTQALTKYQVDNTSELGSLENEMDLNQKDGITYYFNPDGQIYASEQIPDLGYGVIGQISSLAFSNSYFANLISDSQEGYISFSEQTMANNQSYEEFLKSNEPDLANIVYSKDIDQALKLREIINYLKTRFVYSLEVQELPSNQDLFEYFIQTKTGYCTYFATALTILTREAGFESRYIEGFIVQGIKDDRLDKESYQRMISTDQAHAWTEIKINELGWVPLDATPEAGLDALQRDEAKENELLAQIPETSPTTEQTTSLATNTTTTQQSRQEDKNTHESQNTNEGSWLYLSLIFVVLGSLIALVLWRKKQLDDRHDYDSLSSKFEQEDDLIAFIWQDLKALYIMQFGSISDAETVFDNMNKMRKDYKWKKTDAMLAHQVLEKTFYAEEKVSSDELFYLFKVYQEAENYNKNNMNKFQWLIKRFLRVKGEL